MNGHPTTEESCRDAIIRLLAGMSLREKIGQTCQAQLSGILSRASGDLAGYLARYPVGSVFAGKEIIGGAEADADAMRQVLDDCQRASAIPLSVAGDLENGAGGAIRGLTEFPQLMALGAAASPDLAYEYGRWTATEARQAGFNWTFGPVADLSLNWLNPVLGTRCLGDRPDNCIPLLDSLIRGLQDHGLSATAKHFPGDGVDFRDQHLCVTINSLDEKSWRASYGRVFSAVIEAGVQSIMAGHIALPWLDARCGQGGRPTPATVSAPILTRLLREEMGFQGIIVSDALIMAGFTSWAKHRERTIAAFNAGIDVMLWPGENYFDIMADAVETGEVPLSRLDESVRRILAFKTTQGLFHSAEIAHPADPEPVTICRGAKELAATVEARSLTLVRNRRAILPLHADAIQNVLILYACAQPDSALSRIAPFVKKLEARGINVRVHVNGNCLAIAKMEEAGERFDAFLCLFDQRMHDLKNTMRPTGEMGECLWTLQNTETLDPVIIALGSPYLLNDMPYADTLVNAYSSDTSLLEALDKALFGEAGFPGKSPVQTGGAWVSRKICALPTGAVTTTALPSVEMKPMNRTISPLILAASLSLPALAQEPTAELPPPKPAADESAFGAKIARTMTDLATSTPAYRVPVRVLFYGQSISAQPWSAAIAERLKKEFPDADLVIENRAIGGFEANRLMKTAREDLYPFYPDLVIFQVYGGGNGELENILSEIRRQTTAEIMISTHHVSHSGNDFIQAEYDKQSQLIRDLATKYDCELVEVREEWKQYLAENDLNTQDLLRDTVHLNEKGCKLMEELVWRHLRYNKRFANPHSDWIKTVPVEPDANGSYKVAFSGNRIDVMGATDKPLGTARILIDGQPPSANPKAYAITRPSNASDVWWPALYSVGWHSFPIIEDWTLKLTEVSADAKHFKFEVTGSKTGPDGSGSTEGKFISDSGRVVIDPQDFGIEGAQAYSKKPCPPGFEIKWSVMPMFQDTYNPKLDRPTVVQLIENSPHTLEIIPNGDGAMPINAIRVFQPAMPPVAAPAIP